MSITDEDLQFMADAMWKDALLPGDDSGLELSQLLSADEHVEAPAEMSDTLLERKPKAPPKSSKSTGKAKLDWKRPAKPVSGDGAPMAAAAADGAANSKATSRAKAHNKAKDKAKMPPPPSTSPLSDLYLSSLPASLARPKSDVKLSKSMKGASQNEKQAAPDTTLRSDADQQKAKVPSLDPYGLPISPAFHRASHGTSAQKTRTTSPVTSVAKMTSPLGLIPASDKKRPKPQKRIAKRSFLDPQETPEKEVKVKPAQLDPPKAAPAPQVPRQAAKSKRKTSAGKGKGKEQEKGKEKEKERENEKERARPVLKPKPANTKAPAKDEKQASRSFLVPKKVKQEDDMYEVPASVPDIPPVEEITKKLRPRVEKPAIIISSDSETSYSDDDDCSDSAFAPATGDTTIMTTPDHVVEDSSSKKAAVKEDDGKAPVRSRKRPAEGVASEVIGQRAENARPKKLQRQMGRGPSPEFGEAPSAASFEVKYGMPKLANARGRAAFVSEQDSAQQAGRQGKQGKRPPSPANMHRDGQNLKRANLGQGVTTRHSRSEEEADTDRVPLESQGSSSSRVVHSVAASDPFVGDVDAERPQQSQFTTKLLQSTVQPLPELDHQETFRPTAQPSRPRFSVAASTPVLADGNLPVSRSTSAGSSEIAREMMQLLAAGRQAQHGRSQGCGGESSKDVWLNETNPYKETSQIMGYVCNTLLRFLKSKESAVEDVAAEYRQRGSAVLARIKELHGKEKEVFACAFEDKRQKSLEMFEEACRGVRQLSGRLERVSLVPAINNVLADDTVTRLRALQAEMA